MHSAPAFALELSPDRLWRWLCLGLTGLLLLTLPAWLAWHARTGVVDSRVILLLALIAGGIIALATRTMASTVSRLSWQPEQGVWHVRGTQAGAVDCIVDLGDWMLLRHTALAAPSGWSWPAICWLPLSRRDHQTQWHALRCAVFSPGTARPARLTKVPPHER